MQYKNPLISSIFALATLAASSANAEWKYNTEVFFAASDDASVSGIRWLQPWKQDGNSLFFSDIRFLKSDKHTEEINLGGGYRQFNSDESGIWGGYGFLDYRLSASNKTFTQLTLGGEYLLDKWEFRSNFYMPLKDEHVLSQLDSSSTTADSFTGNTLTRVTTTVPGGIEIEEALQGYDIEAGYLLPGSEDFEIRANLGLYQYSAPVAGSTQGLRARIEAFPRENFKVSFSIESDDLFGTRSFLELSVPLGQKLGRPGKRSLHKRMTQFAYRDIDVRETSRLSIDKRTKNGPGTPEAIRNTKTEKTTPEINIVHIDSSTAVLEANATGSIELPYQSIDKCIASTRTFNCASDSKAKIYFLHANASASTNGNAQVYIGNFALNGDQKIIGDGVTTGIFANLSTKISPILLGKNGVISPILTLSSNSQASGLQLGWTYTESLAGSTTPTHVGLPGGAAIPEEAIRVVNLAGDSNNVRLSDLLITGASASGADSSQINSTNNFSTGIHFYSDSSDSGITSKLEITNLKANFILGDAIYAELNTPGDNTSNTQSLIILDSNISKNGRGVHASVTGVGSSSARQRITIVSSNPSSTTIANLIEFNLNEGVLVENLTTSGYSAALQANLTDTDSDPLTNPIPFLASQEVTVKNALIKNNQGAGIQTLFGANTRNAENIPDTSSVNLDNVNLFLNEGSGLVLSSFSSNTVADIKNTTISGNIEKSQSNDFGKRQDGTPIDCATPVACSTQGTNTDRTDVRKTGYGIYAKNQDVSGSFSSQKITISENFQSILHSENKAQIFLESIDLKESGSSQSIDIKNETGFVKLISETAGQIEFRNNVFTATTKTGASIKAIAYCDKQTSSAGTESDGLSPHITFNGLLGDKASNGQFVVPRTEVCTP